MAEVAPGRLPAGQRSYPLNCWYMAAWSDEVTTQPLARVLLDAPVVLFRLDSGLACALDDMCPHRFAPLSMGKVRGDRIECGYHGLQFGASGACLANPSGKGHFPPGTAVRSYPLVERNRIAWFWPGDPTLADESLIPELERIPPTGGYDNVGNYIHVEGNWLLEIDNIMDLTHVCYLHDGSLGNATMRGGEVEVSENGGRVRANLWMPGTRSQFGPMQGQMADQWTNVEWQAPAAMVLDFGAVPPGAEAVQDDGGYAFHIFTPETEHTTHYFFGSSGSYSKEDAWRAELIGRLQRQVFEAEDNPMIRAVGKRMGGRDFWAMRPAILPSDAAAIRVRRRISAMCRAEARDGSAPLPLEDVELQQEAGAA